MFNRFKNNDQLKSRYAAYLNLQAGKGIAPKLEKCNGLLLAEYSMSLKVTNSSLRKREKGVQRSFKPYKAGKGGLFKGKSPLGSALLTVPAPEQKQSPHKGVRYEVVDGYILLSKFGKTDPFSEFTAPYRGRARTPCLTTQRAFIG